MHRSRMKGSCETVRWKEKPEQSGQRREVSSKEERRKEENLRREEGREND